ncbi:unnamed protein product [Orchesella dallaii]|uniref:HRDC domain-containing protein n=1 Tax=Orchesella dallaii TaxID=48710 RepID=A0ABP1QVW5_9HEXA
MQRIVKDDGNYSEQESCSRVRAKAGEFLLYRGSILTKVRRQIHPFARELKTWKFKPCMVEALVHDTPNNIKLVTSDDALGQLVNEISREAQQAWAINEFTKQSFLGMITIIQISTTSHDYVIDAGRLYNKIKSTLGPILEDTNILKVFHNLKNLKHFQRDFDIYPVGCVSTQEAYHILHNEEVHIELDELGKELAIDVSDVYKHHGSPNITLARTELQNAARETRLVFRCWEKLKQDFGGFMEYESFPASRRACLRVYQLPKRIPASKLWSKYINELIYNKSVSVQQALKKTFDTETQYALFSKLIDWRYHRSIEFDVKQQILFPRRDLTMIIRRKPTSVSSFRKCTGNNPFLTESLIKEIIHLVTEEDATTVPLNNTVANGELLNEGEATSYMPTEERFIGGGIHWPEHNEGFPTSTKEVRRGILGTVPETAFPLHKADRCENFEHVDFQAIAGPLTGTRNELFTANIQHRRIVTHTDFSTVNKPIIPESTVASGVLFANKIFGSIFDCHPPSSFPLDGYQLQLPGFLLFPSKRLSSTLLAVLAAARKISKYQG